jgi:hypothetical protein
MTTRLEEEPYFPLARTFGGIGHFGYARGLAPKDKDIHWFPLGTTAYQVVRMVSILNEDHPDAQLASPAVSLSAR